MRANASASVTPSRSAPCGVMPVTSVAIGEGSRSSAGLTKNSTGAYLVELRIGADRGELRDPAAARVGAEGFEIVEEEACGHGFWDWRCLLEWVLAGAALRQAKGKASAASSCSDE